MTDPFAEKNAALLRQADAVAEHARRYEEMKAGLAKVSVTESSPDDAVTVTVDANGLVTDLRVEGQDEIAASVLATMRRAQSRLPARAAAVIQSVEDDPAAVEEALAGYRERFPEPAPLPSPEPSRAGDGSWGARTRR
jgi:DNA-binding protein YbaB